MKATKVFVEGNRNRLKKLGKNITSFPKQRATKIFIKKK